MRALDLLGEALVKLREGREERMMLELAVLRLVRPELDDGAGALLRRLEKLERGGSGMPALPQSAPQPSARAPTAAPASLPSPDPGPDPHRASPAAEIGFPDRDDAAPVAAAPGPPRDPSRVDAPASPPATPTAAEDRPPTPADLDRIWPQLMAGVRERLGYRRAALFRDAIPGGVEGSTLVFTVPAAFHLEQLSTDAELKRFLSERAEALLGANLSVSFRAADGSVHSDPDPADEADHAFPDKDSLPEAPASATDAVSLLQTELGATVIDER